MWNSTYANAVSAAQGVTYAVDLINDHASRQLKWLADYNLMELFLQRLDLVAQRSV